MIFLKTEDEIELLRQSNLLVGKTLAEVAKLVKPGVTTRELDKVAEEFIRDHGATPTFKGFPNQYGEPFPASLCTSVNEQVVHGIPGDIVLKDGDIVSVDCGTYMNGFCGDSAYTFCVGEVDEEIRNLLKVTKEALYIGIQNAVQGKRIGDIGYAIQQYCESHSYGVVREFVGHGIGKEMHEDPQVPNYGKRGYGPLMKRGLCIAIEPMITLGDRQVIMESDGWTVRTSPRYINKMGDPEYMKFLPNGEDRNANYGTPRIKSPKEMIDYVHKQNAHTMISVWASFGPWTEMYQKMDSLKALLHFETWPPKAGVKPYDPFNPTARDMYWAEMKKNIFDLGMDGWWLDSTEPDHLEIKDKDFDTPTYLGSFRRVHNAFPLMSNKGVYEHQRATTSDKRVFLLTRSSFLGQQRYASHSWSGDVVSTWEVMKKQLAAGLNYSLCGIPYWNTDLGGFFARKYNNNVHNIAYHELHVRWYQWGAFQPIMRSHNSSPVAVEIYQFGKKGDWAYDALEKYTHLRYRLLPYLYSTSWEVTNKAGSIIRPLMMDFPKDKKVLEMDTEYMFGRNFLVRPVTDSLYTWQDDKQNGYQKNMNKIGKTDVYLPAGAQWIDFWTGKSLKGGQTIQREVPIDIMPVYVRAGSILPWGPAVQYSTEKKWDNLTLRIYPGADAEFTLYEDEFDNYNYEKGAYTTIAMKWNDKDRTLTINDRQGNYKGMLKNRKFNIIIVEPGKGCGDGDATTFDQSVSYRGKRVDLKL